MKVAAAARAVFLDRDGVINRAFVRDGKSHPPESVAELEVLPGVEEAITRLKSAGFLLIVTTNQPDVARGAQTREQVEALHAALKAQLPIDEFRTCYHDDADGCACRKPAPGLLQQASQDHQIDLTGSYMVGDRWRDVGASQQAGCVSLFVDNHYAEPEPGGSFVRVQSLLEAAEWILTRERRGASRMKNVSELSVKLFADGADEAGIVEMYGKPFIQGFTTNPTLMRKAGITDYRAFASAILKRVPDRPISFEVFSDNFDEMERQALNIAGWGDNVYVKIPITNTRGEPTYDLIRRLAAAGVKVNVTAMMTLAQVRDVLPSVAGKIPCYLSIFAGRIADTGRDPVPLMAAAVEMMRPYPNAELIWASPRELLNIFQADAVGAHVITVTNDVLKKLDQVGKDLDEFSLDTVKMFYDDAASAGFQL